VRRIRLVLEYDGTHFAGFQRQPHARSVQETLEKALSRICGHPVQATGAGRTDAGVHALGQVVHFDTTGRIPPERLALAINAVAVNALAAPDLVVRRAEATDAAFHARFGAVRRTYYYYVCRETPSPFLARYVLHERRLAADAAARMREALRPLVGTHDFAAFRAAGSSARTTVRTVYDAGVAELPGGAGAGALLRLEVTADAFLRSMVRIIAGLALEIGAGREGPDALSRALFERMRPKQTAPPHGLFLARVEYPDGFRGGPPPGTECGWPGR
jgi:tRNA pseudouridine38-40 synthase